MSKAITKLGSCVLVFFFLCSCGGSNSGITLNTKEGIARIKKIVEKHFGLDKEIKSLDFSNKTLVSAELGEIYIHFVENKKDAIWFYDMTTGTLLKPEPANTSKGQSKMLKLEAFNLDDILIHFNEAIAIVKKETGDEFTNFQLGTYYMEVDSDSGNVLHSFDFRAEKITNTPSFYGKRVNDSKLFSFSFSTDKNKTLSCTNGLDIF